MNKIAIILAMLLVMPSISLAKDEISIKYSFQKPVIKKIICNNTVYDEVYLEKSSAYGNVGEPSLPAYPSYILLPQGKDVKKINAFAGKKVSLGKGYNLMPIEKSIPLGSEKILPIKNFISDVYPGKIFTEVGIYSFRGYNILVLAIHPVQYISSSGEIFYYKEIIIEVELCEGKINPLFRGIEKDKKEVIKKIDNPEVANTYKIKDSSQTYELLIITDKKLESIFNELKEYKESRGIKTIVERIENIGYDADKLRDYIREAYLNSGIEYVLLAGDIDIIPAKMLWVFGRDEEVDPYETFMPSDLYYACLDGTFNYDNDDKWGEPNDGEEGKDVDLVAEVYVGRACVNSLQEAKNFVEKTIEYEKAKISEPYLNEMCLAGEYLGNYGIASYGGNYLEQIIGECSDDGYTTHGIPETYNITKLYDSEDGYWTKEDIINVINNGTHMIHHLGHSSVDYNMRLSPQDIEKLENSKYCFIYSQGCYAGAFDAKDCMAEYFTKSKNGAFACIMNARLGFFWSYRTDGDSQRYHREFVDAIFGEKIFSIGKANQDSKEDNLYLIKRSMMRWCYYQLNLFGDPSLIFHINSPPEKPQKPAGSNKGKVKNEYSFSTFAVDKEGDKIYYKWDWGDGNISDWIGPFKANESINSTHSWEKKGVYSVKVIARDEYGGISEWSEPASIAIPFFRENLFSRIFEKFFRFLNLK
ncbi:MAG: C25 family cysteine peptidase [Candidatus Thermoplasmatota archaeon]